MNDESGRVDVLVERSRQRVFFCVLSEVFKKHRIRKACLAEVAVIKTYISFYFSSFGGRGILYRSNLQGEFWP